MRWPASGRDNTRRHGGTSAEQFSADVILPHAERAKSRGDIRHEDRRSADVVVAVRRQTEALEQAPIQASLRVEAGIEPILGIRRAVADVTVSVNKAFEQRARLPGERMFATASRAVEPPDLPA